MLFLTCSSDWRSIWYWCVYRTPIGWSTDPFISILFFLLHYTIMLAFAFCIFLFWPVTKELRSTVMRFKEMKTGGKIDYNHLQNTVKTGHFGTKFWFHPSNLRVAGMRGCMKCRWLVRMKQTKFLRRHDKRIWVE